MSIKTLIPGSTQRARLTALNSFKLFLVNANTKEYVNRALAKDPSGATLLVVMDKYAVHLAYKSGKHGKNLATSEFLLW